MKSVELGELAVDLRLKYKLDAEMKVKNKYPLTVFRSYNSSYVKIRFDNIMKVFHIAIVKNSPKDTENIEDYTEYEKNLTKGEVIVRIVNVLGG